MALLKGCISLLCVERARHTEREASGHQHLGRCRFQLSLLWPINQTLPNDGHMDHVSKIERSETCSGADQTCIAKTNRKSDHPEPRSALITLPAGPVLLASLQQVDGLVE